MKAFGIECVARYPSRLFNWTRRCHPCRQRVSRGVRDAPRPLSGIQVNSALYETRDRDTRHHLQRSTPPLSFPPLCTTERKRSHVPPPPLLRKLSHPVSAVTEAEVKSSRFFVLRFQNFGPASSWCSLVLATWAILTTLENFAAQTFAR